jgi:AGCS family alanine or glycine:cation symporter
LRVAAAMLGSVATVQSIWNFADVAKTCMAVPNLISLIALSGVVVAQTREYLWNSDPSGLGSSPAVPWVFDSEYQRVVVRPDSRLWSS